jgi:DNA-binding transcriptional LysR family regulator
MRFRGYDKLRLFDVAARHLSFTAAAREVNLTKGAVSYQIDQLENELRFKVFARLHRGVALTERGKRLWQASRLAFQDLEREIAALRQPDLGGITVGMSTYFASRWLSPRLMTFMAAHPRIALRLQPLIDLIDLRSENIDMAIRWGKGDWRDLEVEPLFSCPAFPVAGAAIARRVDALGLAAVLPGLTLLQDRDGSEAWADWHGAAGLPLRSIGDDLVIPDPNVRVQAVIDGQGLALNDSLVAAELAAGRLFRISPIELADYGYHLAYPHGALKDPGLLAFRDWILAEARADRPS